MQPSRGFLIVLLAASYFGATVLSLRVGTLGVYAPWMCPSTGIALATLIIFGTHLWPGVAIGAFASGLFAGSSILGSIGISMGASVGALIAARTLVLDREFDPSLSSLKDIFSFFLYGALLASIITTTICVSSIYTFSHEISYSQIPDALRKWWFGDFLGILLIAPALLTSTKLQKIKWNLNRSLAMIGFATLLMGGSYIAFCSRYEFRAVDQLLYLFFPALIWASLQFGSRGTSLTLLGVTLIAFWGSLQGIVPFEASDSIEQFLFLQIFASVAALTSLLLAAALSERDISLENERKTRSQAEAAQNRANFLAEVSRELATSLNYESVIKKITTLAIPNMADICTVYLIKEDQTIDTVMAIVSDTPERRTVFEKYNEKYFLDPTTLSVIRTQKPVLMTQIRDDYLQTIAIDKEQLQSLRNMNLSSCIIVPLSARGQNFGALVFVYLESNRHYDDTDLIMAKDLGYRAALAIENARLYQDAQNSIQLRDDFISIASHELKTPLTPLKMQIRLVRHYLKEELWKTHEKFEALLNVLNLSEQNIDRINRLISNLLDVSRIRSGKMSLEIKECNLSQLVQDSIERLQIEINQSKSPLALKITSPVIGKWDPLKIEQVFVNLLTNAIKYGQGNPIEILLSSENQYARLIVKDHGIGLSTVDQSKLFRRFERAQSAKNFAGLGLGLYISYQIVLAHGGRIRVESEPGKGSSFIVEIPLEMAIGMKSAA